MDFGWLNRCTRRQKVKNIGHLTGNVYNRQEIEAVYAKP